MTEKETLDSKRSAKSGDTEDDWLCYAKFREGDLSAFHELFERYKKRVFNLSYRFVKNREAAEDIAQEVLIKIYEKKIRFRPNTKFSTWVYRVTVNASLDHLRKIKFFGFSLDQPMASGEGDPAPVLEAIGDKGSSSPLKALEKKELKIAVESALKNLPEHLRIPVILFQFEENSYQEIADILGISVKAVERRLYHAKEILRKVLPRHLNS